MKTEFQWKTNVGRENRGWIDHKVIALINGKEIGHLTVSCIPKDEFDLRYPTIWEFMTNIQGWCGASLQRHGSEAIVTDAEKLNLMYRYMPEYSDWGDRKLTGVTLPKNDEPVPQELLSMVVEATKELKIRFGRKLRQFKGYHCHRPYIAYIFVEEKYRRKGIATEMFMFATDKLWEMGLPGIHLNDKSSLNNFSRPWYGAMLTKYPKMFREVKIPYNGELCHESLPRKDWRPEWA